MSTDYHHWIYLYIYKNEGTKVLLCIFITRLNRKEGKKNQEEKGVSRSKCKLSWKVESNKERATKKSQRKRAKWELNRILTCLSDMKSLFAFFTVCSTQKSGNGTENCWIWWGVVVYGADFDDNFYTFDLL